MLIEALSALFLLGVLFALFSALASNVTNRNTFLTQQTYLAQTARPTVDSMVDEIQAAACDFGTTYPNPPVVWKNASGTDMPANPNLFTIDVPDHLQPYHMRRITYSYDGTALWRQVQVSSNTGGPPWNWTNPPLANVKVVDNVTNDLVNNPPFRYYDSDNLPISAGFFGLSRFSKQLVARMTITLTVAPPANRGTGSGSLTVQGSAALRTPWTSDCG